MPFSLEDKHIIVNYHYVEDPRKNFAGIHPCPIKEFEKQIRFLSENFTIVGIQDIFSAAKNSSSQKFCAVTFDDGLKDQYENAVPILEKYNAIATFFPITLTLKHRIPVTHKIHILLSKSFAGDLLDRCNKFLDTKYQIPKDKRLNLKRKLNDNVLTANFKEAMNTLPGQMVENCLENLFANLHLDERKACQNLFMNGKEMQNLIKKGFKMGSHSHTHFALDCQIKKTIRNEIRESKKMLANLLNQPVKIFSYPHSGFNKNVIEILKDETFSYAVTIERRSLRQTDDSFFIPRYDTNDIRDFIRLKN